MRLEIGRRNPIQRQGPREEWRQCTRGFITYLLGALPHPCAPFRERYAFGLIAEPQDPFQELRCRYGRGIDQMERFVFQVVLPGNMDESAYDIINRRHVESHPEHRRGMKLESCLDRLPNKIIGLTGSCLAVPGHTSCPIDIDWNTALHGLKGQPLGDPFALRVSECVRQPVYWIHVFREGRSWRVVEAGEDISRRDIMYGLDCRLGRQTKHFLRAKDIGGFQRRVGLKKVYRRAAMIDDINHMSEVIEFGPRQSQA